MLPPACAPGLGVVSCIVIPFASSGPPQFAAPLPPPHSSYQEASFRFATLRHSLQQGRTKYPTRILTDLAAPAVSAPLFCLRLACLYWPMESGTCGTWPTSQTARRLPGSKIEFVNLLKAAVTSSAAFVRSNTRHTPASQTPAPTPTYDPELSPVGSSGCLGFPCRWLPPPSVPRRSVRQCRPPR